MPIYDYKCSKCDHQFEVIQKFSDKPLKKCPNCNLNTVSKMVSAPSFRLKGGGWSVSYTHLTLPTILLV